MPGPSSALRLNGRKKRQVYHSRAREFEVLRDKLGLTQEEFGELFEFAIRTTRRYKTGEAKVPLSTLILMHLMATGVVSKAQVKRARALFQVD